MAYTPRDYQVVAIDKVRDVLRNPVYSFATLQRGVGILLRAPCRSGKTVIAGFIIENATMRGKTIGFGCRRKELISQCSKKLDEAGIRHGIIQGDNPRSNTEAVQVFSFDTIVRRLRKKGHTMAPWVPEHLDIIFHDECHEMTPTVVEVKSHYPDAIWIGLTATPKRTDGKPLGIEGGGIYDTLIEVISEARLLELGWLCDYVVYDAPPESRSDFKKVKMKGGEFDEKEVAEIVDKPKVIGSVYKNWKLHADGQKTMVFAINRAHGQHLCSEFRAHGEDAVYVDGESTDEHREATMIRFRSAPPGSGAILVSVALYTQGLDVPDLECISVARPIGSEILFVQIFMRPLTPAPGKTIGTILDHGGNIARHGFPTDPREYSLEGKARGGNKESAPSVKYCPACGSMVRSGVALCPGTITYGERAGQICGFELIQLVEAELPPTAENVVLTKKERKAIEKADAQALVLKQTKRLQELVSVQIRDNRAWDYAVNKFKTEFGENPNRAHGAKLDWKSGQKTKSGWKLMGWSFGERTFSAT